MEAEHFLMEEFDAEKKEAARKFNKKFGPKSHVSIPLQRLHRKTFPNCGDLVIICPEYVDEIICHCSLPQYPGVFGFVLLKDDADPVLSTATGIKVAFVLRANESIGCFQPPI